MVCLSPLSTLRFASPSHHFQLTDFCYSLNISSLFGALTPKIFHQGHEKDTLPLSVHSLAEEAS
ncbi:hypothetical protein ACSBR2_041996 [Camellia fascicularis]